MLAVIIAHGISDQMVLLNERTPTTMLPVINKPFIQHLVEQLVSRGVHQLEVINSHLPEKVESLLEDGTRWGCRMTHHLAASPQKAIALLKTIPLPEGELVLVGHGDSMPIFDPQTPFEFSSQTDAAIYTTTSSEREMTDSDGSEWTGWALLTPEMIRSFPEDLTAETINEYVMTNLKDVTVNIPVPCVMSVTGYTELMSAQRMVLDRKTPGLISSAREVEENIWLSRNVSLHPTTRLVPPVHVGENVQIGKGVQLGPYVVVGDDCIVEETCSISQSLILAGSYLGVGLELKETIVDKNRLINLAIGSEITVRDDFILGSIAQTFFRNWFFKTISRLFAAVLLLFTFPIYLGTACCLKLFRKGPVFFRHTAVRIPAGESVDRLDMFEWTTFSKSITSHDSSTASNSSSLLGFLLLVVIPGLPSVVRGDLRLIGLGPRTLNDIKRMPEDWRALYLNSKAGLITETLVNFGFDYSEDDLYASEVYYAVKSSFVHDLKLLIRFTLKLFGRLLPGSG